MAREPKLTGELAPDAGDFGIDEGGAIDPAAALGGGGNSGSGPGDFDPAIHAGPDKFNADGTRTRKRGRKSGGGNSGANSSPKRKATHSLDLTTTQAVLLSIHTAAAAVFKTPELVLADQEAEALAKALVEIERLYPAQIDPRVLAWVNLIGTAGMIYGTRVFAIQARYASEREAKRKGEQGGEILTFTPPHPTGPVEMPSVGPLIFPDTFHTSQN